MQYKYQEGQDHGGLVPRPEACLIKNYMQISFIVVGQLGESCDRNRKSFTIRSN